jgi:uncharacterized Zn finger protein (UPF0148 family)
MCAIRRRLNPAEHCPECGALWIESVGLCPHCGFESQVEDAELEPARLRLERDPRESLPARAA